MGRWVTSKGRRIYIPDEGEENPFAKGTKVKVNSDYGEDLGEHTVVRKLEKNEIPGRFNENAPGGYYEVEDTREGSMFKGQKKVVYSGKMSKVIADNEDIKEKQIAANKKQAEKASGKSAGGDTSMQSKVAKKLSGMSGIDKSKVSEMSKQVVNGVKAGTMTRDAAKAYGLSDKDYEALKKRRKK